jgi:glycyl-tRNA synthetase (class II)
MIRSQHAAAIRNSNYDLHAVDGGAFAERAVFVGSGHNENRCDAMKACCKTK